MPTFGCKRLTAPALTRPHSRRSPNSRRMAAVTTDRVVQLFDENGERKDKFSTKPAQPDGVKNFVVRGMAFSPDSAKLAIAQSDNIVFVYKLGLEWGDKKSICNKFLQSKPVTALTWPQRRHNEVVFATTEGKVKVGQLKTNKAATLYAHQDGAYCVALASSPCGEKICSGHIDGTVWTFDFADGVNRKLFAHSCAPYALSWGARNAVVAAGADRRVCFYDALGDEYAASRPQTFDYSDDENAREFASASFSPAGESVAVGSFDRFQLFTYSQQRGGWVEAGTKHVANLYTVSALGWKPDGSRLATGALCGTVDIYDACVKRQMYADKFEFTYVSGSAVVVKRLVDGSKVSVSAGNGQDLQGLNVYKERFLVAHTTDSLIVGDLEAEKIAEVPWGWTGSEKFDFDTERVCVVHSRGEVSVVEYGVNRVLGTCRTTHTKQHLLSVRVQESRRGRTRVGKKIAYLIDAQTVRVTDLSAENELTGARDVATVSHESKIDWLELNARGTHVLFRDKKRQLHLYDIKNQARYTLLNYCSYVQWVPGSDVVVAQNMGNLCVWYSVDSPDRVATVPIKGEVEDIERGKGKTEVIVEEGGVQKGYPLDEHLIEFNSLVEEGDYDAAVEVLEALPGGTPETEAMWLELRNAAITDRRLLVAQRCSAALGDVAKAQYLGAIIADAKRASAMEGGGDGLNNYAVKARLAMLDKQWKVAEGLLLENGQTDAAIQMYRDMHRLDRAVEVATSKAHPNAENLRREHLDWLKQTGQEEAAGAVKEREGDHLGAIRFYLRGGLPGRAAAVVIANHARSTDFDRSLVEEIAAALKRGDMYERAGELYDAFDRPEEAKEAFVRGHSYRRALELCRRGGSSAEEVRSLEEKWGDHLVDMKQQDAAINHFIEAGCGIKAIEAAVECKNWKKALEIIEREPKRGRDDDKFKGFYKRIGRHYEQARDYEQAERCFLRAGEPGEAVEMYCRADKWENAHKIAVGYMTDSDANELYVKRGKELEASARYKEAEKMYLTVKEHDLAIEMYKRNRQFDQMIRLVGLYRKDLLGETHIHLARQLEADGNYREAERRYLEGKDWKGAVQMYKHAEMWEDAVRVAKQNGGANASKRVAYEWGSHLGGDAGASLLRKFNLLEEAIDYACESGEFDNAFELARAGADNKVRDVHLKHAMYLEDEGRFDEAEAEFIKANAPKEAIEMHVHNKDWDAATRVAEHHAPEQVTDVLVSRATSLKEEKEYSKAEATFVKAKKPEAAIKMYSDEGLWDDALRVAADYLPGKVREIHLEMQSRAGEPSKTSARDAEAQHECVTRARRLEREGNYSGAVDAYLELTSRVTKDQRALENAWDAAVRVAVGNVPGKARTVVQEVAARLRGIGRDDRAEELLGSAGVDARSGGAYQAAARKPARPGSAQPKRDIVGFKDAAKESRGDKENSDASPAAAEEAARRGDWDVAHELARALGPDVAASYSIKHATMELRGGNPEAAADILAERGAPADPRYFALYKEIAGEVLGGAQDGVGEEGLKKFLTSLVDTMSATPEINAEHLADLRRCLEATNLALVRAKCKDADMPVLSAKAATSLLRFCGLVPADRAFFEAGMACREAKELSLAFVFLNRYLDITELMDEGGDASELDNVDFEDTDIPNDFPLPTQHFVEEATREEVRDWVLALSMDQQVEQTLPTRTCGKCNGQTYVAGLTCCRCKAKSEACVVSGYPVPTGQRVLHEGRSANRGDWNEWTMKFGTDPWSGKSAQPKY